MTKNNCILCSKLADPAQVEQILGLGIYAMKPKEPRFPGHLIFASREHTYPKKTHSGLYGLLFTAIDKWAIEADEDYNVIISSGEGAKDIYPEHLHAHYIPRTSGLKMPWESRPIIDLTFAEPERGAIPRYYDPNRGLYTL